MHVNIPRDSYTCSDWTCKEQSSLLTNLRYMADDVSYQDTKVETRNRIAMATKIELVQLCVAPPKTWILPTKHVRG